MLASISIDAEQEQPLRPQCMVGCKPDGTRLVTHRGVEMGQVLHTSSWPQAPYAGLPTFAKRGLHPFYDHPWGCAKLGAHLESRWWPEPVHPPSFTLKCLEQLAPSKALSRPQPGAAARAARLQNGLRI